MLRGKFAPFFQQSSYRVENPLRSNGNQYPRTRITAPEDIRIALTLAKSGLFGGNPQTVLNTPVDIVLEAYHYEAFCKVYEDTYLELNKPKGT